MTATSETVISHVPSALERPVVRVLALSDSDTRMKWTLAVADSIEQSMQGSVDVTIEVASIENASVPSERQRAESGAVGAHRVVRAVDLDALVSDGYSVVVCNAVGSVLHQLTEAARRCEASGARRPIVVTGYAGVVYEKHIEGALWRAAADVVCCNSKRDHERFVRLFEDLGLDPSVLVRSGLAVVHAVRREGPVVPDASERHRIQTVTFAVQPDVPRSARERRYLLERFVSYARRHPSRHVVIKLRSRPDEVTTHREPHHYQQLFERSVVDRPPNLSFEYAVMADVLRRTDVLVTVSSTAAIEALVAGCRVAIVTDLGVRETLGNHFFVGSGLLCSMDDLAEDRIPEVRSSWMLDNGFDSADVLDNVHERVAALLEGGPGPVPRAFYGQERTPYVVSRIDEVGDAAPVGDGGGRVKASVAAFVDGPARRVHRRLDGWLRS